MSITTQNILVVNSFRREKESLILNRLCYQDRETGAAHKAANVDGMLWHEIARLAGPSSQVVYDTGSDNRNVRSESQQWH